MRTPITLSSLMIGAATNRTADVGSFGSARVERAPSRKYDVISARAFAPLDRLLDLGTSFSTRKTLWVLPKGRNAETELEALGPSWQGDFRLETSVTDAQAWIIVAEGVQRKAGRT